jgi:hypothetical protein
MTVVQGEVFCNEKIVASCEMKVFLSDEG